MRATTIFCHLVRVGLEETLSDPQTPLLVRRRKAASPRPCAQGRAAGPKGSTTGQRGPWPRIPGQGPSQSPPAVRIGSWGARSGSSIKAVMAERSSTTGLVRENPQPIQ